MTATAPAHPATHRPQLRRYVGLAVVIVLLAGSNVMANRVIPQWAYIPWNLSMALVLLVVARLAGAGPVAVGLGIRHWHRPVGVGLLLAALTALI